MKKVKQLIPLMQKKGDENAVLSRLTETMGGVASAQPGDPVPQFTAVDIDGNTITSADYRRGKTIVMLWASWNFDGVNMHRMLKRKFKDLAKEGKKQPKVLSLCIDPSIEDTKRSLRFDSISWNIVNDGKMWESPVVKAFGFSNVPDNILIDNGRIVARHKRFDDLVKEIEK